MKYTLKSGFSFIFVAQIVAICAFCSSELMDEKRVGQGVMLLQQFKKLFRKLCEEFGGEIVCAEVEKAFCVAVQSHSSIVSERPPALIKWVNTDNSESETIIYSGSQFRRNCWAFACFK
jgi:hypothetical protein